MNKLLSSKFTPLIITFPSIVIGITAMYINKVHMVIWGQNIVCLIIAGLISYFVLTKDYRVKKIKPICTIIITVIFLLLTFIGPEFQGVNRWISLGPVNFYVASIVIPIIIIELSRLSKLQNWFISALITIAISILLTQQSTAFIIPMLILLWGKTNKNVLRLGITIILALLMVKTWLLLDNLPPVSYVEKILSMVGNMGIIWFILGIASLIILPLPFLFFAPKNLRVCSTCLGIYYIIVLISTIFGNFPVPLMGYGISPIIGYFISITWFVKAKIYS